MISSIKEICDLYQSIYYVEDTSFIKLTAWTALTNRMDGDSVWLMLVGGPSSGKTELIQALMGLPFSFDVSTLTTNTLLSGMKPQKGKDTSLLLSIPRQHVLLMKDFTTILSMRLDDMQIIMSQLREVYDGRFTKMTGMGDKLIWEGKCTLIAGVTEKIYAVDHKFSSMGPRFLYYTMPLQDRKETARRSRIIQQDIAKHRLLVKESFTEYFKNIIPKIKDFKGEVPRETSENIIDLCDFMTKCRGAVERDWKGKMNLVQSPEMPTRISNACHNIMRAAMVENDGKLDKKDEDIIYKSIFDSIPKSRKLVLNVLAKHKSATTKSIAIEINYQTEKAREWLEELNALTIIERSEGRGSKGDIWQMKEEYRVLFHKFLGIENDEVAIKTDEDISSEQADEDYETVWNT